MDWEEHSKGPPIVIDSGASKSVVGEAWPIRRKIHDPSHWGKSTNSFRFGSGPAYESCGYAYLKITVPDTATKTRTAIELNIHVDVVDAQVPFLISMKTLKALGSQIDSRRHVIDIPPRGQIMCEYSPSGHLLLPGRAESMRKPSEDIFAGNSESRSDRGSNSNEPNQQNVERNADVDLNA